MLGRWASRLGGGNRAPAKVCSLIVGQAMQPIHEYLKSCKFGSQFCLSQMEDAGHC